MNLDLQKDSEMVALERWENEGGSLCIEKNVTSWLCTKRQSKPVTPLARDLREIWDGRASIEPLVGFEDYKTMNTNSALQFETRNDLPQSTRESIIDLCNRQLADTFELYTQIKQAHWNVKGMNFMSLHLLFDDLAANFIRYADMIAERATALGGQARGTARIVAATSRIEELPIDVTEGQDLVAAVVERFAEYAASSRSAIEESEHWSDAVTADLFTEILREVDKGLWFLESHYQTERPTRPPFRQEEWTVPVP